MKYVKYFLMAGVAFLSLSSNISRTSKLSEGIYPGSLFPDIKNLENMSGAKIDLSDLRGRKVLVNFWAAYDAKSHMGNVLLANVIQKKNYPIQMVSVSFDENESVYERTVAVDKIGRGFQFIANSNNHADLYNRHKLAEGFKNYLIDENGVIIATNISANDLNQLMKGN